MTLSINNLPFEILQQITLYSENPKLSLVSKKFRAVTNDLHFQKKIIQKLLDGSDLTLLRNYGNALCKTENLSLIEKIQPIFEFQMAIITSLDPTHEGLNSSRENSWNAAFYQECSKWIHNRNLILFWKKICLPETLPPTSLPQEIRVRKICEQIQAITKPIRKTKATSTHLSEVPNQIITLPIQEIDFENNNISFVPQELLRNSSLISLSFYRNNLEAISPSILDDTSSSETFLQTLDLRINKFRSFPEEIFELSHLRKLRLNNNQITEIPQGIEKLKELEVLEISDNALVKISDKLADLPNLKTLIISNNPIEKLPTLPRSLEILEFSNCHIKTLPDFSTLPNLISVNGRKNLITSIPTSIQAAIRLKKLNLVENIIDKIPSELGLLTQLKELYLSKTKNKTG